MNDKKIGFTLIELLIVVAIIAILAAIAIPNFLEAQVRSKVSRCKSDLRSIAVGMEAYRVDNSKYPPFIRNGQALIWIQRLVPLSTPIAYLTSIPRDPFQFGMPRNIQFAPDIYQSYKYDGVECWPDAEGWYNMYGRQNMGFKWEACGYGPDKDYDDYNWQGLIPGGVVNYDPTNGSISDGDIYYFGPGGGFGFNERGTVGNRFM